MRSMQVAHFLERQGFDHVANLSGGIDAWSKQVDSTVPQY
jgi:rhodanese-related sulfurtransferase